MLTLEGIQAERRLKEKIDAHIRDIQQLALNPMYRPDAVNKEKAKLRIDFVKEFKNVFSESVDQLTTLKASAEKALSTRRTNSALAEKPGDTLTQRQLKASKRLEREMVYGRTRDELMLLAQINPARVGEAYREALKEHRATPGSLEMSTRLDTIENIAPRLLESMIHAAQPAERPVIRRTMTVIEQEKKAALAQLRPESVRRMEAARHDFNQLLLTARNGLAKLGELTKANELASEAARRFNHSPRAQAPSSAENATAGDDE